MPFNQNEIPNFGGDRTPDSSVSSYQSLGDDITDDDLSDTMSTQDDREEDQPIDQVTFLSQNFNSEPFTKQIFM